MTIITLSAFALVSLAGIVGTIRAVRTDGYRRIPARTAPLAAPKA